MGSSLDRNLYLNNPGRRRGSARVLVQGHIKLDHDAFRRVGRHCNASLKLGDQAFNHFEAETRPWLVDIEVRRQTDSLI